MLQGVGVDVSTGHVVEELLQLVRERQGFSLDEEDSLVPEWTGPVCVYLSGRENMRATEVVCVILLGAVLQCSEISPELAEFLR